jgi:hypothetical protein
MADRRAGHLPRAGRPELRKVISMWGARSAAWDRSGPSLGPSNDRRPPSLANASQTLFCQAGNVIQDPAQAGAGAGLNLGEVVEALVGSVVRGEVRRLGPLDREVGAAPQRAESLHEELISCQRVQGLVQGGR